MLEAYRYMPVACRYTLEGLPIHAGGLPIHTGDLRYMPVAFRYMLEASS
jgi:hypothetical protein